MVIWLVAELLCLAQLTHDRTLTCFQRNAIASHFCICTRYFLCFDENAGVNLGECFQQVGGISNMSERGQKMKRGITITILASIVLAAGCGQEERVKVTYRSDPPGGTLYNHNGEVWGPCPKVLYYNYDEETAEKGYLEAKPLTVRWPRGPEKASNGLIRISINGTDRQVTFTQPKIAASATAAPGEEN